MTWLDSVVLGVVEGITEFLPISSTGHLILTSTLLQIPPTEFLKTFEISIQLGAILAVVVFFWKKLVDVEVLKRLVVAFIPTGVIGLLLYNVIKAYFLGNEVLVVWALFLGGLVLILFEYWHTEEKEGEIAIRTIPYKTAFGVGLFQALAIVPGVSRSAASILGGLLLGLRRTTIVEFSFLLAVPTMFAASGLDVIKNIHNFSMDTAGLLVVGFVTAFGVAMLSITWLLRFVHKHTFVPFGVYRILVAVAFWFFIIQ